MHKGSMSGLIRLMLAILIGTASAPALAAVTVNFVNPEKYTDASLPGGRDRPIVLAQIEKLFQDLGRRHLSANQTLIIDVLDVDLAGWFEPWRFHGHEIRFVRDITWPKMKLRYSLQGADLPSLGGEETISDPSYLMYPHLLFVNQPLRYERPMIERWFVARLVRRNPPH